MKTITAVEARNRFGQLLDTAQKQPVTVTKKGRPIVVVMSAQDYERRKQRAWQRLLEVMEQTGEHAARRGLTPENLERLLFKPPCRP